MELALLIPVVVLVLFAVVEVALVARAQLEVVHAARQGARVAAAEPDPGKAVAATRAALGRGGRDARVHVVRPDHVGGAAVVTVTLPYAVAAPLLGGVRIDLRSSVTMRVER